MPDAPAHTAISPGTQGVWLALGLAVGPRAPEGFPRG
jgi:hypothetical protein